MQPVSLSTHARAGERGWAMVTALVLMSVMLGLGMSVMALADGQTTLSGTERQKDTAFTVAEAALNATVFALGNGWPGQGVGAAGSTATPWPTCTPSSTDSRCPDPATLRNQYDTNDVATDMTWTTSVYDNGVDALTGQSSGSFYNDTITPRQPSYDLNGDGKLWVRAQSTVRGHTRAIVQEIVVQRVPETMPRATVVAGSLNVSNSGNKVIIDTQGSALQPAPVDVRCSTSDSTCAQYRPGQISPDTTTGSYGGGSALSPAGLARIKATAIANGGYYTTCPANVPSGVAWLEGINCDFKNNQVVNSSTSPGLLVINNGTAIFEGTLTYYGIIYNPNPQNSSGPVITFQGNANISGSVQIDGSGQFLAGSSQLNVTYDPNAFQAINSYGSADLVQGTFRQLPLG